MMKMRTIQTRSKIVCRSFLFLWLTNNLWSPWLILFPLKTEIGQCGWIATIKFFSHLIYNEKFDAQIDVYSCWFSVSGTLLSQVCGRYWHEQRLRGRSGAQAGEVRLRHWRKLIVKCTIHNNESFLHISFCKVLNSLNVSFDKFSLYRSLPYWKFHCSIQ